MINILKEPSVFFGIPIFVENINFLEVFQS